MANLETLNIGDYLKIHRYLYGKHGRLTKIIGETPKQWRTANDGKLAEQLAVLLGNIMGNQQPITLISKALNEPHPSLPKTRLTNILPNFHPSINIMPSTIASWGFKKVHSLLYLTNIVMHWKRYSIKQS